jgi:hypothetical protein
MLIRRREESRSISFRDINEEEAPTTAVGSDVEDEGVDPKEGGV